MILNDNSTQQINTLVIQLQNRITNLNNELKSLNKETSDLDSKISDLERRISSNVNDADDMNTEINNLNSKISDLERRISSLANDAAAMNTAILANTEAISGKADKGHTHTKSQITDFAHNHDDRYYTENEVDTKLSGKSDTGHTHTKSEITDFPTSLPANGGTADSANNGFNSSTVTDSTPGWGYLTSDNGYSNGRTYSFANGGGIATAEKDTKSSLQVDGDLYVHEGLDKVVDENSLKDIMKPNYTTGKLPAGVYKTGQSVSVSASITTTRGNPVFISYSGDFNSVNHGSTVPWISFELFVDDQLVQRTAVDDSVALESDNTPFAGNALVVLSAGSHTIRLNAVLLGDASGQIQFQESDNIVNLVAFEL